MEPEPLSQRASLQMVHGLNLGPVTDVSKQPTLLAVAALFEAKDQGTVRLIDNVVIGE